MSKYLLRLLIGIIVLLGLPLLGIKAANVNTVDYYLQFPPRTGSVEHPAFNPYLFWVLLCFIVAVLLPFIYRAISCAFQPSRRVEVAEKSFFPWWGYLGLAVGVFAWILAWGRFSWFSLLEITTFPALWIAYILVVNALSYRRKSGCLLLDHPCYLAALFPVSTVFWWFFEYLNRFVQNWYYLNTEVFTPLEYILYASVCFSTVLPAVLSTGEFLQTFSLFQRAYGCFFRINPYKPRALSIVLLLFAGAGLFLIGVYPNYLFPLLWVSPLIIIVSLLTLLGDAHLFSSLEKGDWSRIMSMAAAALICGFFWEMWNYYSLYKWEYSVPFVHRYQVFEMPILGYAGYLPFGLECAIIGDLIFGILHKKRIK